MTQQLYFEDVRLGDELPGHVLTVDPVQMFFFSAATFNGHRIHYDWRWATEVEGYADLVVHGPLQAALLGKTLTDWIGGRGRLLRFATENRGSALVSDSLRFGGRVVGIHEEADLQTVDVELAGQKVVGDDLVTLMPATATVSLPSRART